ncbi:hypothetical protein WN943_025771 [Citrus x changshan-huyou]
MDKKSNGVVPNSNDASCDKVHVARKISEDNVDLKDYKPEVQKSNSPSKSRGPANVRTSLTVLQPFALATEKRASGTTRHGGTETAADSNNAQSPMLKKTSQKLSQLDNEKLFDEFESFVSYFSVLLTIVGFDIHRMAASIHKVIVGMAPKFGCSERARKQEEFCTKLEQKHKALEEERSNFEDAALPTNTPSMPCIFIPMEGMVYLAIGCGFKFRAGESAALTGMALADHAISLSKIQHDQPHLEESCAAFCFLLHGSLSHAFGERDISPT